MMSGEQNALLWLYILDLVLLVYFGSRQQYCPGCLYNDLHVFRTGKVLPAKFESKEGRFSATKKWIVGIAAFASLANTSAIIAETSCYFYSIFLSISKGEPDPGEPIFRLTDHYKDEPITDLVRHGISALGILVNFRTSMVAAATVCDLYPFGVFSIVHSVCGTSFLNTEVRAAKKDLEEQQGILSRGEDQRAKSCLSLCCGAVYCFYSKDSYNEMCYQQALKRVQQLEKNTRKLFGIFYYPDLASYAGSRMYEFWVLVWVSVC